MSWFIGAILSLGGAHAAPAPRIDLAPTSSTTKAELVAPASVPAVKTTPKVVAPIPAAAKPTPTPKPVPKESNCNRNYSGCLKVNAGDYDCAGGTGNGPNYTGAVRVIGYDEFGLDRDGDGWGCD